MSILPLKGACLLSLLFLPGLCGAQDSSLSKIQQLPARYLSSISSKASDLENKLDKKTGKALQQMMKQEAKMKKKLQKKDSLSASSIFTDAAATYKTLGQKFQHLTSSVPYIPLLDTLKTSLKFLEQNQQFLSGAKEVQQKLKDAISKMNGLENKLQKAEEVKKFLRERREFLKEQLSNLGFVKQLKKINKKVYYYAEQLKEYKAILNDPDKIEKKAIELLSKTKLFQDFMRRNSMLASLFGMPGDPNDPLSQANLTGLQTRVQVNNLILQQISSGGPNALSILQQNIQQAQSQLQQLKNKVLQIGGTSSDQDIPDFKPSNQKTKTFLQRLELGTNLQTEKARNYFPVTTDIGLSLGYKLNDKSIIGIGASYKIGWGRAWNDISITQQGAGLRSFIDWKIKGSLWMSGGYEMNYLTEFDNINVLKDLNAWQRSGLIGVSKVVSLKTKLFKKASFKLLWDFLSYNQVPRTQPIVFRIGYNFK